MIFFRTFFLVLNAKKPIPYSFANFLAQVRVEILPLLFNFGQINRVLWSKLLVSVKGEDGDLLVLLAEWLLPHVMAGSAFNNKS